MIQAKFSIDESQARLLERCRQLGFKDKSAMVRAALTELQERLARDRLAESARLYAQEYETDESLRNLVDGAAEGWTGDTD